MLAGPPAPLARVARARCPAELEAICEKAMAREKGARYATAAELGDELRAYLEGRVVRAHRTGALAELRKWVLRNRAVALSLVALSLVALSLVALTLVAIGFLVTLLVEQARERARLVPHADLDLAVRYLAGADELWPTVPQRVAACERWLAGARRLLEKRDEYARQLEALDANPRAVSDREASVGDLSAADCRMRRDTLRALVGGLDELAHADRHGRGVASVEWSLELARTVRRRSIDEHREVWERAVAEIADPAVCPLYRGLRIEPQLGLVPLWRDDASSLWEFAHLASGEAPARRADGTVELTERSAIVLVLVPGGEFRMGADALTRLPAGPSASDGRPPLALIRNSPVHSALSALPVGNSFVHSQTLGQPTIGTHAKGSSLSVKTGCGGPPPKRYCSIAIPSETSIASSDCQSSSARLPVPRAVPSPHGNRAGFPRKRTPNVQIASETSNSPS